MATSKRKALTLAERVEVIRLVDSGISCKKVADKFCVGKTQVQNVMKRKHSVMEDFENNCPDDRKRKVRKTGYEDINSLLYEWFKEASDRTVVVTGPMLREKALKFALDLGVTEFKASNGWLDSFLKRHNIAFGNMCGEAGDVKESVVSEWKDKLPTLCSDYHPKDIYNMDETGLFYHSTASKSFHVKGETCKGGKMSKERLTVVFCASMTGEKEPPVVIGKSVNPRCFKKVSVSSLPVKYYANKKAWMTSFIFENWVKLFDKKMRRQGRHVLLFLDNAPSHPHLNLKNVKLQFLPPNTTCKSQPMDQGIIQAVKLKYRKKQLQRVISLMDKHHSMTGSQLLKQVTVLDAIYWINRSWKEVESSTIIKCFTSCGFVQPTPVTLGDVDSDCESGDDDDVPLSVLRQSKDIFGVPFNELRDLDMNVIDTCQDERDWSLNAKDLLHQDQADSSDDDDDDDSSEGTGNSTLPMHVTLSDAQGHVESLRMYALATGNISLLNSVMDCEESITRAVVKNIHKQTKISDFFASSAVRD